MSSNAKPEEVWLVSKNYFAGKKCDYASKVPAFKVSHNKAIDEEREVMRRNAVEGIDMLIRTPGIINTAVGKIKDLADAYHERMKRGSDEVWSNPKTMAAVPEPFLLKWLLTRTDLNQKDPFFSRRVGSAFQEQVAQTTQSLLTSHVT